MTYQEFDNKFKEQAAKLPFNRQLELALEICKRLFFDYQVFYEENEWGNPDTLLDAIHLIEESKVRTQDSTSIATAIKMVEEVTPHAEYFEGSNYALNACTAICSTLDFLIERKAEHIYYVGLSLYDTIDARVQDEGNAEEAEIDQHPIIIETTKYLLQE